MRSKRSLFLLVALMALMLVPETGEAQLLRRRRRSNNGGGGFITTPLASIVKPIAGIIRDRTGLDRSEYDYNWAARRVWHDEMAEPMLFADKVRVKVWLKDEHKQSLDSLRIRTTWVYLHRSRTEHTDWARLQEDGDDVYYDLEGLEEGRVVKVTTDFYEKTDEQPPTDEALEDLSFIKNDEGTFKYVGRMHAPYYGVTSSETNEEFQRRAQIVSFSFSQWYADEAYGGRYCNYDCYSFYRTSTSGELDGFDLEPIAHAHVPELAKNGKRFHGDYLIMPGHYGMALCYDEDTGNFCTIEGNYALHGPYRINVDPSYHGLYVWSSILTISQKPEAENTES